MPEFPEPQSILIVRLSAIGDVVHVLPCLHALRARFPKAHIGWLVEELSASLLRGHPEIDDLYVIPKKRWRTAPMRTWLSGEKPAFYRRLRAAGWDVAIDFQGLTKSGIPALLAGASLRIGYGDRDGRELNKLFTNRRVVPAPSRPHVIQRNMALLEPLGIADAPIEWRFPDFSEERARVDAALAHQGIAPGQPFIALYPGAGWQTKRWPTSHFAELARQLAAAPDPPGNAKPMPVVVVWGPGEEDLRDGILTQADLPSERMMAAPPTDLRELAALLGRARLAIGGDTGPIHLAAALDVPVVGIYGGSDPLRNGPWGNAPTTLLSDSAACTVCWRKTCNWSPCIECLDTISPSRVARHARAVLACAQG